MVVATPVLVVVLGVRMPFLGRLLDWVERALPEGRPAEGHPNDAICIILPIWAVDADVTVLL